MDGARGATGRHRPRVCGDAGGNVGYYFGRYEEAQRWDRLGRSAAPTPRTRSRAGGRLALPGSGRRPTRHGDYQSRARRISISRCRSSARSFRPTTPTSRSRCFRSPPYADRDRRLRGRARSPRTRRSRSTGTRTATNSPLLAQPLGNRGEVLELLGRHAEAERDLRACGRALARQWVGPDHPWTAYPLTALGKTLIADDRPRDAISDAGAGAAHPRTRGAERGAGGRDPVRAGPGALGADQDRVGARRSPQAARDVYRKMPAQAKQAAEVDAWLAGKSSN